MSVTLHFGVIDTPYSEKKSVRAHKFGLVSLPSVTTGDVAEILEEKYHVMETFFEANEEKIVGNLADAVGTSIENLFAGAPPPNNPFNAGTDKIEEAFKDFLSSREAERVGIEGTPTKAALKGVNHRLKHPYAKSNPRRPSFIDTGQYQASFKAWTD